MLCRGSVCCVEGCRGDVYVACIEVTGGARILL